MGYEIDSAKAAKVIKNIADAFHVGDEVKVQVRKYPARISVEFFKSDSPMAGFTLIEQPNCCGVLISTKTFVYTQWQKQGLAQAMMPLKEAIAREFGYSCLSATVNVTGNPAEVHILLKHGWTRGASFINKRTKNEVAFYTKVLV